MKDRVFLQSSRAVMLNDDVAGYLASSGCKLLWGITENSPHETAIPVYNEDEEWVGEVTVIHTFIAVVKQIYFQAVLKVYGEVLDPSK